MSLSSPGIGSNLDINSIVSQLMAVESRPLTLLAKKEAAFQAKLTALGSLKGALSSFQTAARGLSSAAKFEAMSASSSDQSVARASASKQAVPGSYNIHVTQLAQAQALLSAGVASTTSAIGAGTSTTLSFRFGTIEGGSFISQASKLGTAVAGAGIPANSLTINGSTVATDTSVNSARLLAQKINLLTASTGVTASALATDTGALGSFATTSGASSYSLSVGGVTIIENAAAGTSAADIDYLLANDPAIGSALQAAEISFSGTAQAGTLKFMRADGGNIAIQESGAEASGGFASAIGIGKTRTFTSSVTLSSAGAITVGGNNPGLAGLSAGTLPNTYSGASFTEDAGQTGKTVTIDDKSNTLEGLRDAINRAGIGVTASIVSDGSATPHRLVLTATATGAARSMKIAVSGDAALGSLLSFDPAGTQAMSQTAAAQDSRFSVNGIAISSSGTSVTDAIQGVSLTLSKTGSSVLNIARDTAAVAASVSTFVKSFNDLNKTLNDLSAYNAQTRQAAIMTGDATIRTIQSNLRRTLGAALETGGTFNRLTDIGVSFQKDGSLAVDTGKLNAAISGNFDDIASLFATSATASASHGYAHQINELLTAYLASSGPISERTTGLNNHIKDLNRQREGVGLRLQATEQRYRAQFSALDKMISSMNQTSTFLQQQLKNLPKAE